MNRGDDKCIAFNGRRVDEAVGGAPLRALERARYEADRAFRKFAGVDPENRQVAAELERG